MASPSPCAGFAPLLPGFAGRELAGAELEAVRRHLRGCAACRCVAKDFQQAQKALKQAARARADELDVPFAELHAEIIERVAAIAETDAAAAAAAPATVRGSGSRWLLAAAALLLAAFGYWLAGEPAGASIWERAPIAAPADDVVRVVPYAGSPAEIRPAALDERGGAERGIGPGMMGRGPLREPVELLPAVYLQRGDLPDGR